MNTGENLTPTERTVLALMADGMTNKEICNLRHVSMNTTMHQVKEIYRKLGALNRAHAIHIAHRTGLIY
jgi:DNA-binding CsgD family transcriptional regulator